MLTLAQVLRHARKLPEKTVQFYKELNRLKRAAVCLGFYELLEGVAQVGEDPKTNPNQTYKQI